MEFADTAFAERGLGGEGGKIIGGEGEGGGLVIAGVAQPRGAELGDGPSGGSAWLVRDERPTRRPVNEPGPIPAANASIDSSGASASSASGSTSPAFSVCSDSATARPSSHRAQLSRADELSSARTRKALLEELPHRVVAQREEHQPQHERDADHVRDLPEAERQRPPADALDPGREHVEAVEH